MKMFIEATEKAAGTGIRAALVTILSISMLTIANPATEKPSVIGLLKDLNSRWAKNMSRSFTAVLPIRSS